MNEFNVCILKARHTQAVQKRLNKLKVPYRVRLNAVAMAGQRKCKVWEK